MAACHIGCIGAVEKRRRKAAAAAGEELGLKPRHGTRCWIWETDWSTCRPHRPLPLKVMTSVQRYMRGGSSGSHVTYGGQHETVLFFFVVTTCDQQRETTALKSATCSASVVLKCPQNIAINHYVCSYLAVMVLCEMCIEYMRRIVSVPRGRG